MGMCSAMSIILLHSSCFRRIVTFVAAVYGVALVVVYVAQEVNLLHDYYTMYDEVITFLFGLMCCLLSQAWDCRHGKCTGKR